MLTGKKIRLSWNWMQGFFVFSPGLEIDQDITCCFSDDGNDLALICNFISSK